MAYRVVDTYDAGLVHLDGQEYPNRCLLEDEDGIRLLLIDSDSVPVSAWVRAHADGAQAILALIGGEFYFVLTELFIEYRTESGIEFFLPRELLSPLQGRRQYTQLLAGQQGSAVERSSERFVHLHTHSEYSALDGLSTTEEMIAAIRADGQVALAITDHGTCAGHPDLQLAANKHGIKPIFGMEAYFVPDRHMMEPGTLYDYQHLVLWAMDDQGLRNLWAMSTEAYRTGLFGKKYARLDWDILERLNEGVLASTACLRGPVTQPWLAGDEEGALANLGRLKAIFGDRLYVELHANQLDDQIKANRWLVEVAERYGIETLAVVDSHYPREQDRELHRTWLSVQTGRDNEDETSLFGGGQHYHLMTEAEVYASLEYLGADVAKRSIINTARLADRCTATIEPKSHRPIFSRPSEGITTPEQRVARDVERLMDVALGAWKDRVGGKGNSQAYMERFQREMSLIIKKGFCGYFLTVWDLVTYAKRNGVLVGAGRGSGVGSLVAFLSSITEIDPIEAVLMFERFMTDGREALPDFDIDFPSSRKQFMLDYAAQRWGADHVCTVGTHLRLKNKSVINSTATALASELPEEAFMDMRKVATIIDDAEASTAGLGMSWDELWAHHEEELEPYRKKYPKLFEVAGKLRSRLKTYGTHPAGIIIDPDNPVTNALPLRNDGTGRMITQFDMAALESLGFVKFDLLNIRTLDTVQLAVDLIRENTGREINPYTWTEEYSDPQVYGELAQGWTLGVFQIETRSGTRMMRRFQPQSVAELADVTTLVRPGPTRSGLTETYLRRREGDEPVHVEDGRLAEVLSKTYGTMLYQEDIMAVCMVLAGYDSNEADEVRKILGKKKVDLARAAGEKFVQRARENATDENVALGMWEQMEEFAKYCVAGDTEVHLAASGPSSDGTVTAERLYNLINAPLEPTRNGGPYPGKYAGPCNCCGKVAKKYIRGRCNACYVWLQKFRDISRGVYGLTLHADDRIRPARILMVHKHEPAETWKVTLADGRSITATANHRHVTPQGLRRVDELRLGDLLVVDHGYDPQVYEPEKNRVTKGQRQLVGAVNGAFGEKNYGYIDGGFARLMAWTAFAPDHCQWCGHDGSVNRLERAHLDGDRTHNSPENLAMLCVSCHKKHDYEHNGRRRRWEKGHLAGASEIVSIESAGVQPVYSIVMDDPHIWIGNGIATANSFNRAHAYAYAILAFWSAWLKFHYPIEFLCASLSTVDTVRIPEFVEEVRRLGYSIKPPDVNISNDGFTIDGMSIRYGLLAIDGIGGEAVKSILETRPYTSWEDFWERGKTQKCNAGSVKRLVHIGAMDSLWPNRRALEELMAYEAVPSSGNCRFKDMDYANEFGLPCRFDWASEPLEIGKSGKPRPRKAPPKKCTKGCRQFSPKPPPSLESVEPYTEEDIRQIELKTLGVYLSSTPFDRIPEEVKVQLITANELVTADYGRYLMAAIIGGVRKKFDSYNRLMGWLTLTTESGTTDCVVFSGEWQKYGDRFQQGLLCLLTIKKTPRGNQLVFFEPLD